MNEKRIVIAKVKLMKLKKFWGFMCLQLKTKEDVSIPTMATDGEYLYYNPAFEIDDIIFAVAHEVGHCILGHIWRRGNRDRHKWNIACDFVVNYILEQCGFKVPKDVLYDSKYEGMSAEQVYNLLPDDNLPELCFGEMIEKAGIDPDKMTKEWKDTAIKVASSLKDDGNFGSAPSDIVRAVKDIYNPKIKWQQVLEGYLSSFKIDDYSCFYDRRLIQRGIYIEDCLQLTAKVAVALDTSGSISEEELRQFLGECLSIVRQRGVEVIVITCDSAVHEFVEIGCANHEQLLSELKLEGGGGTNFVPVFKELEDRKITPNLLVYFTDLEGTFPREAPGYDVLWVASGRKTRAPFGRVVEL